jgi:Dockerin type I domain
MKKWGISRRWVCIFTFFIGFILPKTLVGQTYCFQFNETVVGSKLEVDIILTPSSPFRLGSTTAKFSVNPQAISLANPIQFTSALPTTYTTNISSPAIGIIAFDAFYTGAIGVGKNVPTTGLKLCKMVFNIIDPMIATDIKLLNKGIKSLSIFKDDNSSFLAPSAQCPPSPYTSTFYDAHIELDADIPMDECVDNNTPGSVKINFGDDETREILPAGFKFIFYCKDVTSLRLGADGALLVNADPSVILPSTNQGKFKSIPRIIAPWWDEWRKGMGTINCLVKNTTLDGVPTRMLIIQWNNVSPMDNITGSNLDTDPLKATFNVVIFENSSVIKFNYKDIDFTNDIASRPDLLPVVEQKQNGVNGSVGMKGICGTGIARDVVNNIVFDGPIGISLFDVNSARVYKSITFKPILEDCIVPLDPLVFKVCQNSTSFKIPLSSAAINGHWEGTGTPFLNNINIQVATFNPTVAGSYSLKWMPECPEFSFDVNITVSPSAIVNAGPDQSFCSSASIKLLGTMGGSAVGATWSASSGTFSDPNALMATYSAGITSGMVTLALTSVNADATCPVVTSTMKVTVYPAVYAGEDGAYNVCGNAAVEIIDLFKFIKGAQTGGTWTRTAGSGGSFDAAAGTFTTAANMTSSLFKYTLKGTAPCPDDESRLAINLISPADAGKDGSTDVCDNSITEIDLRTLITGEQNGGGWVRLTGIGGVFNKNTGTFTPTSGATTSTFEYTVAGFPPCAGFDKSMATVNIAPFVTAGTDGATTICENSTTQINLNDLITGEQTGGTWVRRTGTGGTFYPTEGMFVPNIGITTSTFAYRVNATAPCANAESIATINVIPQANAGSDGSTTICDNSTIAINLYNLLTGGRSGGVWTRLTGTGGDFNATDGVFTPSLNATTSTFKYFIKGVLPCVGDDEAIATVNITPQAHAGLDGTITVCDNSATIINLFSLMTGAQTGGVWTRLTGTRGIFNAAAGIFTPSVNATNSTFKYTVIGISPCVDDEAIATVNIVPQVNAGTDGGTSICNNSTAIIDLYSLISGEQSGGIWTRLTGTGGVFDATTGSFTPSVLATSSTFQYSLTGVSPCPNDVSIATVDIVPQANAGRDGSVTQCESFTTTVYLNLLIVGEQSGGVWTRLTGTGGSFDPVNATFTPAAGTTTSTFQYTVKSAYPCSDGISIATVNIIPSTYAGLDGEMLQCDNVNAPIDLFSLITNEQTGGVWTRLTGTGGIFNASAATFTPTAGTTNSSFQYRINGLFPCSDDVSVGKITILPKADAGADGTLKICSNARDIIDLNKIISGQQSSGVWTRLTGTGGLFSSATGLFIPSVNTTNSSFKYAINGGIACASDESMANIIIIFQMNAGIDGSITVCNTSTTAIDLYSLITGEQTGGYWTRVTGTGGNFNATAGTFTPSVLATSSIFKYNLPGLSPCSNAESFATINLLQEITPTFSAISFCQNTLAPILPQTSLNGVNGIWAPAIINNQASAVYTFIPVAGSCAAITTLTVTVIPNAKPNAGADQLSCVEISNQSYNLSASAAPAGSLGVWSFAGAANGASFINQNAPNTSVINVNTVYTLALVWTVTNAQGCTASDTVMVGKDNIAPTLDTWDKNAALAGSIYEKGADAYVCASIVIKELSDNCTSYNNLMASAKIVRDADNPSNTYSSSFESCIRVTCADLNKKVLTQVWVVDRAGNASFHYTSLSIQDNMGFCKGLNPQAIISIATETNRPVNNTLITATASNAQTAESNPSGATGIAKLTNLVLNEKYQLKATKTDEQYLGVTTFDVATMSQHILGTKTLISPYALLAADINEDGEIDGMDILLLRNFILRRTNSLPKRSWRFVDSSYVFKQPQSPFSEDVPEIISFTNVAPSSRLAFKAIKKGDVFSTSTTGLTALALRNNSTLTLQTEDILLEKGREYAITVNCDDVKAQNFQFTLGFTEGGAMVKNIERGDMPNLSENNFGVFENAITTSWNGKANATNIKLFTLHFKAEKTGFLSEIFTLNSSLTPTEAYDTEGNPLQIQLKFTKAKIVEKTFALYQNYPNPVEKQTQIAFNLPKDSRAHLTIYNTAGQIIFTQSEIFPAGLNEINIDKKLLITEGVLYYRLDTPEHSATRKMIVLK